jgi:hypothetical protein
VVYCQNKPISEYIVAEHYGYFEEIGRKLKHKLLVSTTPITLTLYSNFIFLVLPSSP